jgi:lysophospholipase L1-like esterase
MTTFVALGDSITLGIGDPVRKGDGNGRKRAWRGWAALLAEGLPDPTLHILGSPGARMQDLEKDQLALALPLRPDVAGVVTGVNDTLRSNFDPATFASAAAHTVGALRAAGAQVLTMRMPDPGKMLHLPNSIARPLARRMGEVNAALDSVAERFGTLHYDAAGDSMVYDPRMWAVDRLHPSERGHRLIACRYYDALVAAGVPMGERPDPEPSNPPPTKLAEIGWMATKGTAWVLRRSTDLIPGLLALAIKEAFAKEPWTGEEPGPEPAIATMEIAGAEPDAQQAM